MVLATKFCGPWKLHDGTSHMLQSNFGGGASKNLHLCVEASLRKLRTTYIDLVSRGIAIIPYMEVATANGIVALRSFLGHDHRRRRIDAIP